MWARAYGTMCRFCRLDVQPDLFGGFAVVKEWGRIGARGRMMDEWHTTEAQALAALQPSRTETPARISVRVSDAEFGGC